ncbi:ectoine/hydroxyectoine ABC transporter substrate-binding protein EhuB [Falsochrobactrum shanghaiense]|uniref:Ectoine/hydroxyectoine ABC transporter substrate-binding protein EhuB n=1 Tax=Falsochrobactrum shanghaiense TaxID=2201899 RepID=A0A316J8M5_9HYPH|nr:ectoine/hydroxyectoine ABC transporter substrate-binding protein EhuB [Falsochrobactrum shanghaiense]PWL18312.1 ectoine/hydroxyectoine ABC transporter substrate-binding protein EhuB [Falsochrobactrum shanghaiense]
MRMKLRTISALLSAAAVIALTIPSQAVTLDELKSAGFVRGATANEVPYGYMDASGAAKGIGPDVAAAIFKKLGLEEIDWTVTPFGSLIPGLKAKRFEFVAAEQAILPERCKQVQFSVPNSSYGEGLLVPKGNPKNIHSYDDIKKDPSIKVAIVSGADQIDFLHAMGIEDSQIVMLQGNADAPSTVQTGRADAYAATELTVAKLVENSPELEQAHPFTDPVIDGKPARSFGAFSFRPDDKEFFDAFNKELVEFKKTDDYAKILMTYGLSEESVEAARAADTESLCAGK